MTKHTCSSCQAYSALSNECRFNAPTPILIQKSEGGMGAIGIFPSTTGEKWCMQHISEESAQA